MQSQAIRITIELPQAADVQATYAGTGGTSIGAGESAPGGGIDAGPPSATLVATLGDPEMPTTIATVTDERTIGSADAIDAGSFPAQLAMDMEARGPRHPLGHPEIGMQTAGTSTVLSREARN